LNQNDHFYDAMVSFEVQIVSIFAIEIQWFNPMLSYMDGWSEARSPWSEAHVLGKKPVTNGGSGVRRSCAVESVLVDKPSL